VERRVEAAKAGDPGVMLGLLSAVERDSAVTQRHLARELGIALGLANAYLRRCANKGLIKMRQAPLNRYAYYLTPRVFAEKSRLTAEYLALSLDFFCRARRESDGAFDVLSPEQRLRALDVARDIERPFADLIGSSLSIAGHERVYILLNLLGRSVRGEVPALAVEVA
jgi:DNA-binding MarR family transcriptional regulator